MNTKFNFIRRSFRLPLDGLAGLPLHRRSILLSTHLVALCALALSVGAPASRAQQTPSSPTPYTLTSRGLSVQTWQRTLYEQSPSGQMIPHLQKYEEIAAGLNFISPTTGELTPSSEEIVILSNGTAAATNGETTVLFPADIFEGAIQLQNGGLVLREQPQCVMYSDGTNYVVIGTLTNSIGTLISSNQVLYPGAIVGPGGVECDLLLTYRKSGLEADTVFRSQPPAPEQFGFNGASVKVQLLTEFFNPPTPTQTPGPLDSATGLRDTALDFGPVRMIRGRAFLTGGASDSEIPVFKSWTPIDANSSALIEQVPYSEITASLTALPKRSASRSVRSAFRRVSFGWDLPAARRHRRKGETVHLARVKQRPGFIMDYITINSDQMLTNFMFQGDTTYYISGPAYMYGDTVLEPGSVLKMNSTGQLNIDENGTLECDTSKYLPAICTSYNDNAVGDWFGSGSPALGDVTTFLNFNSTNVVLHDLNFAYATRAITQTSPGSAGSINLWDCEFVDVATAVYAYNVGLYNVLIGRTENTNAAISLEGPNLVAENVTADDGSGFVEADYSGATVALTNCLVTSQPLLTTGSSVNLETNAVFVVPSPSAPIYQVVGAGNYYLADDSPYQGIGTTNIDSGLLEDLAQKTTYPPIVYADTNISGLGTLGPVVSRDAGASPDIGFHYSPLDYVFGGCDLYTNLTITSGTAVGWFEETGHVNVSGQPYGITLNNGANLSFSGTATLPCNFSQYAMVQERGNNNWNSYSGYMAPATFNGSIAAQEPQLSALFTKFSIAAARTLLRDNSDYGAGTFKDCEFYDCAMSTFDMQYLNFTNCLLFRNAFTFWDHQTALNFCYENCTFYDGLLATYRLSGEAASSWVIQNSAFDGTAFAWGENGTSGNITNFNYNAYNTNNLSWESYSYPYPPLYGTNEVMGPNDVMVTNYNWESGWFTGSGFVGFYLPTNSPLLNAGSTTANLLGLYHFTSLTNDNPAVIEGDNTVDIGYSYVATDQYGNPLDSNSDGIPDYLEDANGNGLVDSGEIGWNITGDPGLQVIITQPRNGSTLP